MSDEFPLDLPHEAADSTDSIPDEPDSPISSSNRSQSNSHSHSHSHSSNSNPYSLTRPFDSNFVLTEEFTKLHVKPMGKQEKSLKSNNQNNQNNNNSRNNNNNNPRQSHQHPLVRPSSRLGAVNSSVRRIVPVTPRLIRPSTAESRSLSAAVNPRFIAQVEAQIDTLIDQDMKMELESSDLEIMKFNEIEKEKSNKSVKKSSQQQLNSMNISMNNSSSSPMPSVENLNDYLALQDVANGSSESVLMNSDSAAALEDEAKFYRELMKNNQQQQQNQNNSQSQNRMEIHSNDRSIPNPMPSSTNSQFRQTNPNPVSKISASPQRQPSSAQQRISPASSQSFQFADSQQSRPTQFASPAPTNPTLSSSSSFNRYRSPLAYNPQSFLSSAPSTFTSNNSSNEEKKNSLKFPVIKQNKK